MKKILFTFLILLTQSAVIAKECAFGNVTFDSDFLVSRLNDCDRTQSNQYVLTIEAENYPVNSSPWYAFKVFAKRAQNIGITIRYKNGKNRYLPKISSDGKSWTQIPYKINSGKLKFNLEVGVKPIWVAGQEIIGNDFYQVWLEALERSTGHKVSILGRSTENLPIYQLEAINESDEWVVLLGRMHPPEVTGAFALFPFVQTILSANDLAESFRKRFNVLVIPNLNPDGVAAGNWRHNSNGVDLNRDWNVRNQKETQIVHKKLQSIIDNGGKIVYAIDFHSTYRDIFYSMPTDYGAKPASITEDWLGLLDKHMPDFEVVIKPGSNPDKGVFKQYIADTYGVHAVTYEMGDNTERKQIKRVAHNAAETFMTVLLSKKKEEF